MDHPALFRSVKARDIEQLHRVLGPTLHDFGANRIIYWDHAHDGILTSLGAIPGTQGYDCLRWAEQLVDDAHRNRVTRAVDVVHAEYVYRLRATLLSKALERVADFEPAQRLQTWQSICARVAALAQDVTAPELRDKPWLVDIQSRVLEGL